MENLWERTELYLGSGSQTVMCGETLVGKHQHYYHNNVTKYLDFGGSISLVCLMGSFDLILIDLFLTITYTTVIAILVSTQHNTQQKKPTSTFT